MYVIQRSEKNLWTVGCMSPYLDGTGYTWCPLRDCKTAEDAMRMVHYLNGGDPCGPPRTS